MPAARQQMPRATIPPCGVTILNGFSNCTTTGELGLLPAPMLRLSGDDSLGNSSQAYTLRFELTSLSDAAKRRSRCGSVRGWPAPSSHFSPGLALQVGQPTVRACFSVTFIATDWTFNRRESGQFWTPGISNIKLSHYHLRRLTCPGIPPNISRFLRHLPSIHWQDSSWAVPGDGNTSMYCYVWSFVVRPEHSEAGPPLRFFARVGDVHPSRPFANES